MAGSKARLEKLLGMVGLRQLSERFEATARKVEEEKPQREEQPHERVYSRSKKAREHAARGEKDEAKAALDEAMAAWQTLRSEPRSEEYAPLPYLALAAVEVDPEETGLREAIAEIIPPVLRGPPDNTRSDWHRGLAWALTDLGDWHQALDLAHGITDFHQRYEALTWLAVKAPFDFLCTTQAFLEDDPVRWILLGRLAALDDGARRRVEAVLGHQPPLGAPR